MIKWAMKSTLCKSIERSVFGIFTTTTSFHLFPWSYLVYSQDGTISSEPGWYYDEWYEW